VNLFVLAERLFSSLMVPRRVGAVVASSFLVYFSFFLIVVVEVACAAISLCVAVASALVFIVLSYPGSEVCVLGT